MYFNWRERNETNQAEISLQETRIVAANFDHTIGVKTPEVTRLLHISTKPDKILIHPSYFSMNDIFSGGFKNIILGANPDMLRLTDSLQVS